MTEQDIRLRKRGEKESHILDKMKTVVVKMRQSSFSGEVSFTINFQEGGIHNCTVTTSSKVF